MNYNFCPGEQGKFKDTSPAYGINIETSSRLEPEDLSELIAMYPIAFKENFLIPKKKSYLILFLVCILILFVILIVI